MYNVIPIISCNFLINALDIFFKEPLGNKLLNQKLNGEITVQNKAITDFV